jgi:hypothetical protein
MDREKVIVPQCAKDLGVSGDIKIQEVIDCIITERGNDPVLVRRPIATCLRLLNEEVECHSGAQVATEAIEEPTDTHSQQLECLSTGACNLEDAINRKSVTGVIESRKELILGLKKFKASLSHMMGGSITKSNLQRAWRRKGECDCWDVLETNSCRAGASIDSMVIG